MSRGCSAKMTDEPQTDFGSCLSIALQALLKDTIKRLFTTMSATAFLYRCTGRSSILSDVPPRILSSLAVSSVLNAP